MVNIANTNNFKSFKYKAKLLQNTVAQPAPNAANGTLRNATIPVPLKYLKVVSATFLLACFVCLSESTCETIKIVFRFILKALFVLESKF